MAKFEVTELNESVPSLSVIIPVFNGGGWIGQCLKHIRTAVGVAGMSDVEVLLIDDGSTDFTLAEATAALPAGCGLPLTTFSQPNSGRFAARQLGLEHAKYEFVLFIDTRVFIGETALAFVGSRLRKPDEVVWTSHVEAATEGNPTCSCRCMGWYPTRTACGRVLSHLPRTDGGVRACGSVAQVDGDARHSDCGGRTLKPAPVEHSKY